MRAGQQPSEMTFVVGVDGGIQILADNDWPLESLAIERGARMLFRVCPIPTGVAVIGRDGSRKCHLESRRLRQPGFAQESRRFLGRCGVDVEARAPLEPRYLS